MDPLLGMSFVTPQKSLLELKAFVRERKLNKTHKPDIQLSMSKTKLLKGLLKHGYLLCPLTYLMPPNTRIIHMRIECDRTYNEASELINTFSPGTAAPSPPQVVVWGGAPHMSHIHLGWIHKLQELISEHLCTRAHDGLFGSNPPLLCPHNESFDEYKKSLELMRSRNVYINEVRIPRSAGRPPEENKYIDIVLSFTPDSEGNILAKDTIMDVFSRSVCMVSTSPHMERDDGPRSPGRPLPPSFTHVRTYKTTKKMDLNSLYKINENGEMVSEVPPRVLRILTLENKNEYELTVYRSRNEGNYSDMIRGFYVEPFGKVSFKVYADAHVIIVPQLDVNQPSTNESIRFCQKEELEQKTVLFTMNMKDYPIEMTSITINTYTYAPPKSELERWKEVGLKSHYLLQQLIKLGGMKYPNMEPMLDMVQDISVPPHTEHDKERAGIPSGLTNITQETDVNEPTNIVQGVPVETPP